jgi:BirA family biotin operon repressor/biotin-[acetyl-CoA-carboxylase] ligase
VLKENSAQTIDSAVETIDQQILGVFRLRQGEVVSGAELSGMLRISRTAVWKHIKSLKALGYRIVAVPARGYRLLASPETFVPAEIAAGLTPKRIGKKIICFKEADSTNSLAFKLAEEGAAEGTVVIADGQSRGKGRLGREWVSPDSVNLYCSIILRPSLQPVTACQLTFLSVVAVARTVEQTTTLKPRIKWPNDLLINGRKVAGLLNEMSAETEKVNFVVLGIGVNINMRSEQFPSDLRHPASSLLIEGGVQVNRNEFVRVLLGELDSLYDAYLRDGYGSVREEWLSRSQMCGRRIRVASQDRVTSGVVKGIDDIGALLLITDDGREERVLSGDVTIL